MVTVKYKKRILNTTEQKSESEAKYKIYRLPRRRAKKKELNSEICLNLLKKVLEEAEIPSSYYSLCGYSEEAICIEKCDDCWVVYEGEKGNKHNRHKYSQIRFACFEMISRLSENREEYEQIKTNFRKKLAEG